MLSHVSLCSLAYACLLGSERPFTFFIFCHCLHPPLENIHTFPRLGHMSLYHCCIPTALPVLVSPTKRASPWLSYFIWISIVSAWNIRMREEMNGFQLKFFISKPRSFCGPTTRVFWNVFFFQIKSITYSSFGDVKKMLEYAVFKWKSRSLGHLVGFGAEEWASTFTQGCTFPRVHCWYDLISVPNGSLFLKENIFPFFDLKTKFELILLTCFCNFNESFLYTLKIHRHIVI